MGVLPMCLRAVPALQIRAFHDRDGRETHGRDARATAFQRFLLTVAAISTAMLGGCTGGTQKVSSTPPPPVDEVDRIIPLISPSPVNWDGRPGADGLEVCVHFFRYSQGLPVTVRGSLEFVLYEGVIGVKDLPSAKPFRSWRFSSEELKAHRIRRMMGWGYAMRLPWGNAPPTASAVTLLVRYTPLKGRPVSSDPTAIPLSTR